MNISIRWKLAGAFTLSMLLPIALLYKGCGYSQTVVISLLVVVPLFLYSSWRILSTIRGLQDRISMMGPGERRRRHLNFSKDELSAALLWTDELIKDLETQFQENRDEDGPGRDVPTEGEFLIKGNYGTGLPIQGIVAHFNHNLDNLTLMPDTNGSKGEELFLKAISITRVQLKDMRQYLNKDKDRAGIIDFQIYFLDDENFIKGVKTALYQGESLRISLDRVFDDFADRLSLTSNSYIRNRISDLFDLKKLIYESALVDSGAKLASAAAFKDKIVYCQEVFPSDVIHLHRCGVVGFIIVKGTPSSHAQILLESLNLSSVSGLSKAYKIEEGETVAINPLRHHCVIRPFEKTVSHLLDVKEEFSGIEIVKESVHLSSQDPVYCMATLNMADIADRALHYGADGIGLFRSEFAYLNRNELPKEEELLESYRMMTNTFQGKEIIMRMLDVGGDKLTWFHSQQGEENPSMGNRSMRFLLKHQNVFRTQARAMLQAATAQTTIIYPMVSGIDELDRIESCMQSYYDELLQECELSQSIQYGIMIEVPSVVERFEDYIDRFDHFNLGTNDLAQYTLAADRNNKDVSEFYSHLHPSILKMIYRLSTMCNDKKKALCICGQSSTELSLLPLWLGLGLRRFSLAPTMIPIFKNHLASLDIGQCQSLAEQTLRHTSIKRVKQEILDFNEAIEKVS